MINGQKIVVVMHSDALQPLSTVARRRPDRRPWATFVALLLGLSPLACSRSTEDPGRVKAKGHAAPAAELPVVSAAYQINCGGGSVGPFSPDKYARGGYLFATTGVVDTQGVKHAAPAELYQSERYGTHSYSFPSLTPNAKYTVRLHFAEIYFTKPGARQFNVLINGVQVVQNLDIFAAAGASHAMVRDFMTTASSSGQIVVQFVSVLGDAKSNGIEILSGIDAVNQGPIVSVSATAAPNPVTGLTSTLSALGTDDAGESSLTYTWATAGAAPGTATFEPNGTNAAKSSKATFSKAGTYGIKVTITDEGGLSITSSMNAIVGMSGAVTPVYQIDCGGGPAGGFSDDRFFSQSKVHTTQDPVATQGVPHAAPPEVYQSERYGNFSYTLGSLTPGSPYTVRLHFAETFWNATGSRVFNVLINGVPALTNFDIFAATKRKNAAIVRDFETTASGGGQIVIQFVTVVDNAEASAIEILTADPQRHP